MSLLRFLRGPDGGDTWEIDRTRGRDARESREHFLPGKAARAAMGIEVGDRIRCRRCGHMVEMIHLFGESVPGPGALERCDGSPSPRGTRLGPPSDHALFGGPDPAWRRRE